MSPPSTVSSPVDSSTSLSPVTPQKKDEYDPSSPTVSINSSSHQSATLSCCICRDECQRDTTIQTEGPRFMEASTPMMHHGVAVSCSRDLTTESSVVTEEISTLEENPVTQTQGENTLTAASTGTSSTDLRAWRRKLESTLYERAEQEAEVVKAFERSLHPDNKEAHLLLISGPSGVGTTRLAAQTLKDQVMAQAGYYLTGKCDQFCRPAPYTAFVAAFTEFTNMVLLRGEEAVWKMRHSIQEALADGTGGNLHSATQNLSVLTSMIPALEKILGGSCSGDALPVTAAKTEDALQRFVFVFRMFVRAVSSPEQPIVLMLDDLQYADCCSLDLLFLIVTDQTRSGLVLVGTCDSSAVSPEGCLAANLREMEDGGHATFTNVCLENLKEPQVERVLTSVFDLQDESKSRSLAQQVYSQTGGNFFYMIEFLQWLQDSNRLVLNSHNESDGTWTWNEENICNNGKSWSNCSCSIEHFLHDKMTQLPTMVQEVIKYAACLGGRINDRLLECLLDLPSVTTILQEAVALDVLGYDKCCGRFIFQHDCLQLAAYHLIPEAEREEVHLDVGRQLWRRLDLEELDRYIFVVLSQMQIGAGLLTKEKEKVAIAKLCLHGGKKAAKSSTFRTASVYLNFGISLLDGDHSWRKEYDLTLALYSAAAEMEMCCAHVEEMEELIEAILKHARCLEDKLPAYGTQMYSLGSRSLRHQSLDLGIKVLEELGEPFPRRLSLPSLYRECYAVKRLLKGRSDEQLLRIPPIENQQKLQALQILQFMILSAVLSRPKFAPFVLLKCMRLTLEYGLSVFASVAFSSYAMLCMSVKGDVELSNRFADLSLILLERFEAMEYLPRVYTQIYYCVYHWSRPLRDSAAPLLQAHRVGLQTGDTEFSFIAANLYLSILYDSGTHLDEIERDWKGIQTNMINSRQESMMEMALPWVQLYHHLMGLSDDPLASSGDVLDYDLDERRALGMGAASDLFCLRLCRVQLYFIFKAYDKAAEKSALIIGEIHDNPPSMERVNTLFFGALVALAMARKGTNVRKNLRLARKCLQKIKTWARAAPYNFLDKRFLIEAEQASVLAQLRSNSKNKKNHPKNNVAYEKYTCAIAMARDSGFPLIHALSNERCGLHFLALNDLCKAKSYLQQASAAYKAWGAHAKVNSLQEDIRTVFH